MKTEIALMSDPLRSDAGDTAEAAASSAIEAASAGVARRQDAQLADAVNQVLAWTGSLPTGAVAARVADGWVTLSGEVDWPHQRQAAADSVRGLNGVSGLSNRIRLRSSQTATSMQSDIESALVRTSILDARRIHVAVHGSDVTLSGTVRTWDERNAATRSAWSLPGVRSVVDMMTLAS